MKNIIEKRTAEVLKFALDGILDEWEVMGKVRFSPVKTYLIIYLTIIYLQKISYLGLQLIQGEIYLLQ